MSYAEIYVDQDYRIAIDVVNRSGRRNVPQIFIDKVSISGYEELASMYAVC